MKVGVCILSSGRPDLLKRVIESLKRNLKCIHSECSYYLHEDMRPKAQDLSIECLKLANASGYFMKVLITNPAKGQAFGIEKFLKETDIDYMLKWEDDFIIREGRRELDLDVIINLMERNREINQIIFFKDHPEKNKDGFEYREINIDGYPLIVSPHWAFIPAIWRIAFIKPKWVAYPYERQSSDILRDWKPQNPEWVIENMGTYFWGNYKSTSLIEHIGTGRTVRC